MHNSAEMDLELQKHLLATCSALGGPEPSEVESAKTIYVLGDECLGDYEKLELMSECLKDLKRQLKFDHEHDPGRNVLLLLGSWDILRKDLVPIFMLNYRGETADQELLCNACGKHRYFN